ncbi:MAG: DUF1330 domain-containing protein [Deltaproteobacteria bacterium]|nr:DUF1330 domain-containing protein [Candidatus Zymogenaceae bacterium]
MEKVTPLHEKHGGRVKSGGVPTKSVIEEFDADLIFLVEYPSRRAFIKFIHDPEYADIKPYREEAIVRSLLIKCDKLFQAAFVFIRSPSRKPAGRLPPRISLEHPIDNHRSFRCLKNQTHSGIFTGRSEFP